MSIASSISMMYGLVSIGSSASSMNGGDVSIASSSSMYGGDVSIASQRSSVGGDEVSMGSTSSICSSLDGRHFAPSVVQACLLRFPGRLGPKGAGVGGTVPAEGAGDRRAGYSVHDDLDLTHRAFFLDLKTCIF